MKETAWNVIENVAGGGGGADAIIQTLAEEGFVIVPKEPTEEMISLALKKVDEPSYDVTKGYISADDLVTSYRAMIAAA